MMKLLTATVLASLLVPTLSEAKWPGGLKPNQDFENEVICAEFNHMSSIKFKNVEYYSTGRFGTRVLNGGYWYEYSPSVRCVIKVNIRKPIK